MTITSVSPTRRRLLQLVVGVGLGGLASYTSSQSPALATSGEDTDSKTVAVSPDDRYVFTPGTENPLRITAGRAIKFVWESDTHNIYGGTPAKR
jgi:plastocyanin